MKFEVFLLEPFCTQNTDQNFSATMQDFAAFPIVEEVEPIPLPKFGKTL
jgi:hypothetical protein